MILQQRLDKQVVAHFARHCDDPPFSDEVVSVFRSMVTNFLQEHGQEANWAIRPGQPMALHVMNKLSVLMNDADVTLFDSLLAGVPTGFHNDIPLSGVFPIRAHGPDDAGALQAHFENWTSAEDNLELTRTLVEQEVKEDWVFRYPGDLAAAQADYPAGVSLGKLGIAFSEGRKPRLVVDSTISGLNARCRVPERVTLPSAKDVLRCYPIRQESRELAGFSIDIKSAHKRIVVRPSEQGLVGFTLDGVVYFYKVAPFGACFSAAWWARLGGWILRFWHLLIWIAHTGHLFVDDFLFMQRADIIPITAAMVALSCQVLGIPVSWAKTELSGTIKWIGWVFHISTGFLEIPEDKVRKIHLQISDLLRSNKTTVKSLQKFIGLAMWITQLFPFMRIWLHHLYRSLNTIPATHYSVEPDNWGGIVACLSDKLVFVRQPQGTAIPVGATLLSVSHQAVGCLTDLSRVRIPHKRIWLRIVNPHSTKRRLDSDACRTLHLFQDWLGKLPPVRVLRPKPRWHGDALADACAHGSECQIGGFLRIDSSVVAWYSEKFTFHDFERLSIPVSVSMQKNIACFETLAQMALIFLMIRCFPSFRLPLVMPSLSDNAAAEAGGNKLFSTSFPHCLFLEKMCLLSSTFNLELDISHIAGQDNVLADALSRWDQCGDVPQGLDPSLRLRFSLSDLWIANSGVQLCPPSISLKWDLP